MSDRDNYVPRFSFEISEELKYRANKVLATHGIRRALMTPILEDLVSLIEEHGQMVIGAILDEAVKPRDVLRSMARAEKRVKNE